MKAVTTGSGQSILDMCVQEYGTLESLFQMHLDNGLSEFPAVLPAGLVIMIDQSYELPVPIVVIIPEPVIVKTVPVRPYQTILDICLQEYGTLESLFRMHQDNLLSEFPAVLLSGQEITIDAYYESPYPLSVKLLQQSNPATGKVIGYVRPGGIGFMEIGVDFIVN